MNLRAYAAILSAVVIVATAGADAATLGLYFDTDTFPTEIEASGPVDAWLVLREVTPDTTVSGWECSVEILADGSDPILTWELMGTGAYNFATPPVFAVGLGVPFPVAETVVLARATIIPTAPGEAIALHAQPYINPSVRDEDGYPIWRPVIARQTYGDILEVVQPASGASWSPEARVNSGEPLPCPEIGLDGNSHFGSVPPGGEEIRTLLLSQPGPATVYGLLAVTGDGYSVRIEDGPWTTSGRWLKLSAGVDVPVDVRFAPGFAGPSYGSLVLDDGGPLTVLPLTGGGGTAPALVLEPDRLEFGSIPPGSDSHRTVTLRNDGAAPLTVTPGTPSPGFAILEGTDPFELAPGAEHVLTVAFAPAGPGQFLLNLDLGPDLAPLLGHGHAAGESGCDVTVNDPEAGDFGTIIVGQSVLRDVVFANTGSWDLAGEVQILGDPAFTITAGGGPVDLPGGAAHTVTVLCDPTAGGSWQAVLVGPAGCSTVPLSCAAEMPLAGCALDPEALDFGAVGLGYDATLTVTVTNDGNVDLIGDTHVAGDAAFTLATGEGPFTLPPGETIEVQVTFAPDLLGPFTGQLDLGTGDCDLVPLAGVGRDPVAICVVDPEVLSFGNVMVGMDTHRAVTVANVGELPLIIEPVVTGDSFSLRSEPGPITVAPGTQADVDVGFRCPAAGLYEGALDLGQSGCSPVTVVADGYYADGGGNGTFRPLNTYFGVVPLGLWSERDISVTNNMDSERTVAATTNHPDFAVVAGNGVILQPYTATWLTVRFTPTEEQYYNQQINTGFGGSGVIRGYGAAPGCDVDPREIVFETAVFGTALAAGVSVSNANEEALYLEPVCDDPAFTVEPASLTIPPLESRDLTVHFLADGPGEFAGTLDVGADVCGTVDLAATALDTVISCEVSPESVDLGPVYVNELHTSVITVTNTGGPSITVSPVIDPAGSPFSVSGGAQILQAGQSVEIPVNFATAVPGSYAATLLLGDGPCSEVPLAATALELPPGDCAISPAAIFLGDIPAGLFVTRHGVVSNVGESPLSVDLIDEPGVVHFVQGGGPFTIPVDGNHSFIARFYAPSEGDFEYEVPLAQDCGLPVSGYGTPPAFPCEIEPYVVDLGTVLVGQTYSEVFSIRNVSDSGLQLNIAAGTGPFQISGAGQRYLGPLSYVRPGATFAPDEPGDYFLPLDLGPDSCGPALLRGTALASVTGVVAKTRQLDFGVLDPGELGRLFLEVANTGDATAVIDPTVIGEGFGLIDAGGPRAAEPGEVVRIGVACVPTAPGLLRGRLDLGVEGHPDILLVAEGRDPDIGAPVIAVVLPDGLDKAAPGDTRVLVTGELRLTDLAPGSELISWRGVLQCDGGRIIDWRPAGDTASLEIGGGAPLVILPGAPLIAAGDGTLVLATFTVEIDQPGEVVLRVHGGAERNWPVFTRPADLPRQECAVSDDYDHVVARFTVELPDEVPGATRLRPVYPNPFNPGTNISFELAQPGRVRLRVFDVTGRLIATVLDESRAAGLHLVRWEGRDDGGRGVASGTYYLRLEAGGSTHLEKMTLLK